MNFCLAVSLGTQFRATLHNVFILLSQIITTNTVIFCTSSSLYCTPQTLTTNTVTFCTSSSIYCTPQTLTTNTVTFCTSSSLYCPPQTLTTNTVTFSNNSSLSLQITATHHDIKTDCGVGVTAVGYTWCCILFMVGDRACKSGNTVS